MKQLSSQISREDLKNNKSNICNIELLNKTIADIKTDIYIADVTHIGKLLYKIMSLNSENNDMS